MNDAQLFAEKVFADANALMDKVDKSVEFRAKQTQTKEWCYGYFAPAVFINEYNMISHISPAIITLDLEEIHFQPVDPETVGRFTGLTDYSGRKIFEADIVKIQIGNIIKYGAVFYGERAARIGIKDSTGEANFSFMQQPLIKQYQIIVIGNIFDSPELLKGE